MSKSDQFGFRIKATLLVRYHALAKKLGTDLTTVIKDFLSGWYQKNTD